MRLDHGKIEVFGQQQANITAMADHKRHLSKSGLANDAISRKTRSHQAGHPVDVGLGCPGAVQLASQFI